VSQYRGIFLTVFLGLLSIQTAPAAASTSDASEPEWREVLAQADNALSAGRLVQADAMLSTLELAELPDAASAVALSRAEYHMAQGNVEKAENALAKIGENPRKDCRAERVSGWIAGKTGQWNKAILRLADAIDLCGDGADLWNLFGLALIGKKEYSAALEAFDSALILDPKNAALLSNRALALVASGRLDAALQDLMEARKLQPGNLVIMGNADYLSGLMGIKPVRNTEDSDNIWAQRLARAGDGSNDSSRKADAISHFANATLLLDRFDFQLWSRGSQPLDVKTE
jgi:tetratricopeptide (TPR) repeat protein